MREEQRGASWDGSAQEGSGNSTSNAVEEVFGKGSEQI